ncbi:type VII secretion target [Nocardia sp. NPDC051832]|uniref:type VII secretion target n=1 Tax=Nocardia sp. NPDC051832 TaxID=3155673 RepID=UPI00341B99CB
MTESLDIDLADMRRLAADHSRVADKIREWAEPPHEWLRNFESMFGTINDPVNKSVHEFFDARKRAGFALADDHDETAQALRDAADAYERTDSGNSARIHAAGAPDAEPTRGTGAPGGVNGTAPEHSGPVQAAGPAPVAATPAPDRPDATPAQTGSTPLAATAAPQGVSSALPGAGGSGTFGSGGAERPPTGASGRADIPPVPVPTPFAAAVSAAKDKAAEPAHVVGEAVDEDLVIARTLLSAVLAAAGSTTAGLTWAVSVMRGADGIGVFLTSNEGRGWLPAGVFVPQEVSTPWVWDDLLADGSDGGSARWEGLADPARILVEFGTRWGPRAGANLTALVSSGPIDPDLRRHAVATQGNIGPTPEPDLRVWTPDTTDRLGLAGSSDALEFVAQTPDSEVGVRCNGLAAEAQQLLGSDEPGRGELGMWGLRERVIAAVDSETEVPQQWWDELRDANDVLGVAMAVRRIDASRIPLGELRIDDDGALRRAVFERRCNELVLLLAEEPTRQCLRDSVYAYEQIVNHPQFVPLTATAPGFDRGPVGLGLGTAAGRAASGPPKGASAAAPGDGDSDRATAPKRA